MTLRYSIRNGTDEERDYCYATWLRSLLRGRRNRSADSRRASSEIQRVLYSQSLLVAVVPGDSRPEDVIGWICYTPLRTTSIVHYVYVRNEHNGLPVRRRGVATELLRTSGVDRECVIPYTSLVREGKYAVPKQISLTTGAVFRRLEIDSVVV